MLRRLSTLAAIGIASVAGLPAPAHAAAILFDFEGQPIGEQTPFTIATAGLSATFAGPSGVDPGAFGLSYNSSSGPLGAPYRTLSGAFLDVGSAFGAAGSPLTITFSAPLSALRLAFALDDPANATALSLATDAGGAASARGSSGYRSPEGTLSFSGAPFTVVTLSSGALDFQVDDLTATTAAGTTVPEPASLAALCAGLAAIPLARRRASRRHSSPTREA